MTPDTRSALKALPDALLLWSWETFNTWCGGDYPWPASPEKIAEYFHWCEFDTQQSPSTDTDRAYVAALRAALEAADE